MKMGSMDRALTAKSQNFRQICQWTAAASLVATGSLALFSASAFNKIQHGGRVTIDLDAFSRVGSVTIALDRVSDEQAFREEGRLIEKAAFATAEALPEPMLAFEKIRLAKVPNRRFAERASPSLANSSISRQDALEIAQLERVADPKEETQAIAQIYRNLRYRFIVAAEAAPRVDPDILLAEEAFEYEELPAFDPNDFRLTPEMEARFAHFDGVPEIESAQANLGTEPTLEQNTDPEVSAVTLAINDAIQLSASSPTIAHGASSLDALPSADVVATQGATSQDRVTVAPVIFSPGLDLMPERAMEPVNSHQKTVTTQLSTSAPPTGPPRSHENSPLLASTPLPDSQNAISGVSTSKEAVKSAVTAAPLEEENGIAQAAVVPTHSTTQEGPSRGSEIDPDYAADIQSAYVGTHDDEADSGVVNLDSATSTRRTNEDSIIDGDFQTYSADTTPQPSPQQDQPPRIAEVGEPAVAAAPQVNKNYGYGVSRDAGGITIDWNARSSSSSSPIFVGTPNRATPPTNALSLSRADKKEVEKKFTFETAAVLADGSLGSMRIPDEVVSTKIKESIAPGSEPNVDLRKCETARIGVEAFQPGSENESLAICRRALSHEGLKNGDQARWWENYPSEGSEHWPALVYRRPSEITAKNRVPLLSTSAIRILTTLLRVNTHSGMGIVFGEVADGLDIKILGRADQPIYLDGGMRIQSGRSGPDGARRRFVFLNVEPGQPLLQVKTPLGVTGAIPLVVKAGMGTHIQVEAPVLKSVDLTLFDASAEKETRLAKHTAEVVGQPGRLAISDAKGLIRIEGVAIFGEYPLYIDITQNQKSYKNRYRIGASTLRTEKPKQDLYFFAEKRIGSWLAQLSGGVSKHSGLIVGVAPKEFASLADAPTRHLKMGVLEKRSSLVPERYHLNSNDELTTESAIRPGSERYLGVQIPEGPCIPTVVDETGTVLWSTLVYAQPGVINVVTP